MPFDDILSDVIVIGNIKQDLSVCRGCKTCMVCPSHLFTTNKQGQCIRADPQSLCMGLGMCVDLCPTGSLSFVDPNHIDPDSDCLKLIKSL